MKKILILLCLTGLIASCSSEPTKEETDAANVKNEQAPARTEPKVEKKPVEPTPPSKYVDLEQAIASKNYEKIKLTSSEILISYPKDIRALNSLAMYYLQLLEDYYFNPSYTSLK